MAVWEPCPLNKSTNKNANSHISREGTQPKTLPHIPRLPSSLSTKLRSPSLMLSLARSFAVDRLETKWGRQIYLLELQSLFSSVIIPQSTYPSFTFSPSHSNVNTLVHVAKAKYSLLKLSSDWCVLPQVSGKTRHIKVYGYVWRNTNVPWLDVPPVCLSADHPHAYQQVQVPKIALTWESCVRSWAMQIDAALNEQRIMLATSVKRALKNSCFVSGMALFDCVYTE